MNEENKYPEKAKYFFRQGYNCAQSVFLAFHELCGLEFETAARLSSSFGAGMGRLREVCGAVTAIFMVVGMLCGYDDPDNHLEKTGHYQRIQLLADEFEKKNGSIICRELLGLKEGRDCPIPEKRTDIYYASRPCEKLVESAAEILADYLLTSDDLTENPFLSYNIEKQK